MNHFLDNRVTAEDYRAEVVAKAFKPGMGASDYVEAFIAALPETTRLKWDRTDDRSRFSQQHVRWQLEDEYNELMEKHEQQKHEQRSNQGK